MIQSELYKVFIKQRLIFFLIALLCISFFYCERNGYDTTGVIQKAETYYTSFFQKYEGQITEEKSAQIKDEYDVIEKDTGDSLANEQELQAFESFYHIYLYEADTGSGYLADTRGFETLLCHNNMNYFLVLFLILYGVILFATEYECEMDLMIQSTSGKNRLTKTKIILGLIGAALASIVFQMIQIIYLSTTVGLRHAEYPLNTIEFFENTSYQVSLGQAVIFRFVLNIFGSMLLISMVMFVTVLIKKKEFSLILSFLLVILPIMFFPKGATLYKMPGCTALLSANAFLWPDRYTHQINGDQIETVLSFQAIGKEYLIVLLIIDVLLLFLFSFVTYARFTNYTLQRRKRNRKFLAGLCICLCMTGCGKHSQNAQVNIDGTINGQADVTVGDYEYYIEQNKNEIYQKDKNGNEIELTKDAFPLEQTITNIYVDEDYCYYLLENDDSVNIIVRRIDLDSFEDKLVFSSGCKNTEDFYGLIEEEDLDAEEIFQNIATVKWFFVEDSMIVYQRENTIYKCSEITGREEIIDDSVSDGEICYQDSTLSYADEKGERKEYTEEKTYLHNIWEVLF